MNTETACCEKCQDECRDMRHPPGCSCTCADPSCPCHHPTPAQVCGVNEHPRGVPLGEDGNCIYHGGMEVSHIGGLSFPEKPEPLLPELDRAEWAVSKLEATEKPATCDQDHWANADGSNRHHADHTPCEKPAPMDIVRQFPLKPQEVPPPPKNYGSGHEKPAPKDAPVKVCGFLLKDLGDGRQERCGNAPSCPLHVHPQEAAPGEECGKYCPLPCVLPPMHTCPHTSDARVSGYIRQLIRRREGTWKRPRCDKCNNFIEYHHNGLMHRGKHWHVGCAKKLEALAHE